MATIPQGNFGNSVASAGPGLQAPAPSQIGAALERQGQIAFRDQAQTAEARQRAAAATTLAKVESGATDAGDEVSRGVLNGDIEPGKAHGEFDKRLQKITSTNMNGWSADQQAEMGAHITRLTGRIKGTLTDVIEKRNQQDTAGTMDQYAELQLRKVMTEGPAGPVGRYAAMVQFTGGAAGWNPQQQAAKVQQFKELATFSFFDAAATAALEKGDDTALKDLRAQVGGEQGDAIDPPRRAALTRTIMSYERQVEADRQSKATESKFDVVSRTKDVQGMVLQGVTPPEGFAPTVEEYTALYGKNGPAMWQREVGSYQRVGNVLQQMRYASAADRAQMVDSTKPAAGAGFADDLDMHQAVVQAKTLIERQLVEDPAAYALKNSMRVQRAHKVMQGVMSDADAPAGDKIAAMDFFARTTTAEQLRLGVGVVRDEKSGNKPRAPKILTNEQANAIADQFNDQTLGGAKAAVLVQGLEATYGKYWPQVYAQLAGDNKLPPAALVIPNMQDPGARARLAQASVTKPEVFKEQLAASDPKDISDSLLGQFDDARASFSAQGADGMRTLSTVMKETEKLALLYRAQGKSIGDSTRQAYTEVMGWKYDFPDNYRVPKSEQAGDVAAGARNILRGLDASTVSALPIGGVAPDQALSLTLDAIKANGQWITNGDESGLRLMVQGKDGAFYPVRKADGSLFDVTWADLRSQAVISATPEAAQRRKDRGVQR